jgi:transposase
MARSELVDDGLWELLKPLLPGCTPQRTGRPRVSDRAAFTAIAFVVVTGVPWRLVPQHYSPDGVEGTSSKAITAILHNRDR